MPKRQGIRTLQFRREKKRAHIGARFFLKDFLAFLFFNPPNAGHSSQKDEKTERERKKSSAKVLAEALSKWFKGMIYTGPVLQVPVRLLFLTLNLI